jgi:hypothetical protein
MRQNSSDKAVHETLISYLQKDKADEFNELCQAIIKTRSLLPSEAHKANYMVDKETLEDIDGKTYAKLIPMQNGVPQVGMSFTKYTDLALRLRLNQELSLNKARDKDGNPLQIRVTRPSEPTSINTFASYANSKQICGLTGSPIVNEKHMNIQFPAFKPSLRQDEIYFTGYHQANLEQQKTQHNNLIIEYADKLAKNKNLIIHVRSEEEGKAIQNLLANKGYELQGYYGSRQDSEDDRARENQAAIDFVNPEKNGDKKQQRILITSVLNRGSDFKAGAVNELKTYFCPNAEDMEGALERLKQELGRVARSGSEGRTVSVIRFDELRGLLYRPVFTNTVMDLAYLQEIAKVNNPDFLLHTLQHLAQYVDKERIHKRELHALKSDILAKANAALNKNQALSSDQRSRFTQFLQKTLESLSLDNKAQVVDAINEYSKEYQISKIILDADDLVKEEIVGNSFENKLFAKLKNEVVSKFSEIEAFTNAQDLKTLISVAEDYKVTTTGFLGKITTTFPARELFYSKLHELSSDKAITADLDATFVAIKKALIDEVYTRNPQHWKLADLACATDLQSLIKIAAKLATNAWTAKPTTLLQLETILKNEQYAPYLKLKSIPADFKTAHLLEYADKGFVSPVLVDSTVLTQIYNGVYGYLGYQNLSDQYDKHYRNEYIVLGNKSQEGLNRDKEVEQHHPMFQEINYAIELLYDQLSKSAEVDISNIAQALVNSRHINSIVRALKHYENHKFNALLPNNPDNAAFNSINQSLLPLYTYLKDHNIKLESFIGDLNKMRIAKVELNEKLENLLELITNNTDKTKAPLNSYLYTYYQEGTVQVGDKQIKVCLPRCVLDAYDPASASKNTGSYNLQTVVNNLKEALEEASDSVLQTPIAKINGMSKSLDKCYEVVLKTPFKEQLEHDGKVLFKEAPKNELNKGSENMEWLFFDNNGKEKNVSLDNI